MTCWARLPCRERTADGETARRPGAGVVAVILLVASRIAAPSRTAFSTTSQRPIPETDGAVNNLPELSAPGKQADVLRNVVSMFGRQTN